jgi:hypothetical protein
VHVWMDPRWSGLAQMNACVLLSGIDRNTNNNPMAPHFLPLKSPFHPTVIYQQTNETNPSLGL